MKKKMILMLAAMALLLTVTVGSTIAFLATSSGPVENVFEPTHVTSTVVETFTEGSYEKTNVKIKNTGNTDAKIRAAIVVTWKDANGNTLPNVPKLDVDYSLTIAEDTGWTKNGDYYYYDTAVAPENETGVLITQCKQLTNWGTYRLCVEIIGSAIQAEGGAYWGVDPTESN